jgi:GTP-binding protein
MNPLPVVAIVGRPNVGKSSLLNALTGKTISIVQDMPGVTRDRISTPLRVTDRYVELVDTGGYGFVDPDALTEHIRDQIEQAMARADLVLFLVDCEAGLTAGDEEIAKLLREAESRRRWSPTRPTAPRPTWRSATSPGSGWGRRWASRPEQAEPGRAART